jgi:hypothetical protein
MGKNKEPWEIRKHIKQSVSCLFVAEIQVLKTHKVRGNFNSEGDVRGCPSQPARPKVRLNMWSSRVICNKGDNLSS